MGAGSSSGSAVTAMQGGPGSLYRSTNDLRALIKTGSSTGTNNQADATKSTVALPQPNTNGRWVDDGNGNTRFVESGAIGSFQPRYNLGQNTDGTSGPKTVAANKAMSGVGGYQMPVGSQTGTSGQKTYLGG